MGQPVLAEWEWPKESERTEQLCESVSAFAGYEDEEEGLLFREQIAGLQEVGQDHWQVILIAVEQCRFIHSFPFHTLSIFPFLYSSALSAPFHQSRSMHCHYLCVWSVMARRSCFMCV